MVQASLSLGGSVSSGCDIVAPLPSQTNAWQSPGTCMARTVPAATFAAPHLPALHVEVTHAFGGIGQPCGVVHGMPPPPPVPVLELEPPPPPVLELEPPPHPAEPIHSPRSRTRTMVARFMKDLPRTCRMLRGERSC